MEKMKKTARGLDKFFKVLYVLVWVLVAILALSLVLMAAAPFIEPLRTTINTLELGGFTFTLAPGYGWDGSPAYSVVMLTLAVVYVILAGWEIRIIRKILKPMTEGVAFHDSVGGNLKKLGWLQIAGGLLSNAAAFAGQLLILNAYDLEQLFVSEKITAVNLGYELDISFVVTAAVFFLASYIFRYGTKLQQLSDETL